MGQSVKSALNFASLKMINWYPGHMHQAFVQMQKLSRLTDIIIEVVDARAIPSCLNPLIKDLAQHKYHFIFVNRTNQTDPIQLAKWKQYYQANNQLVFFDFSITRTRNFILRFLHKALQTDIAKMQAKHIVNPTWNILVVGAPNTGKSTLINLLSQRKATVVRNYPGTTRSIQKVKVANNLMMIDNPGVLMPKFQSIEQAYHLGLVNIIKQSVLPLTTVMHYALDFLVKHYDSYLFQNTSLLKKNNPWDYLTSLCYDHKWISEASEVKVAQWLYTYMQNKNAPLICWDRQTNK